MEFVFTPPTQASVAVEGTSARFPVRRIFCVGRNYAEHAREMGNDPDREPPFFFTKPADAVCDSGSVVAYPPLTANMHHEIELVVAIGAEAVDLAADRALETVWGYGVGIDLTRRDLQKTAKDMGRPWDWAKGFDMSAPCGQLRPVASGHVRAERISLAVNGETRQQANISDLIWSIPEVIAQCSAAVKLMPGDLIFTGTPAGVSAVQRGDRLSGHVDGLSDLEITIG